MNLPGMNTNSPAVTIDRLEQRTLMSATPTPVVHHGILKVWGTSSGDYIQMALVGSEYWVMVNDSQQTFVPAAGVTGVLVYAGNGNDRIDLDPPEFVTIQLGEAAAAQGVSPTSIAVPTTVFGGRGDDTITGGTSPGNEFYGGSGDDLIQGTGTLHGGTGDDTIDCTGNNTTAYGGQGNDTLNNWLHKDDILNGGSGDNSILSTSSQPQSPPGYIISPA